MLNLAPRELRALWLGGLVTLGLLGYFLIWEPLAARQVALRQQVAEQAETWRWMQAAVAEAKSLRAPGGIKPADTGSGPSLPGLLDQSLRQGPLATLNKRLEPKGDNSVRVEFTQVGFDDLLAWLIDLRAQHPVQASAATIERLDQPGQVKAWLTLER